MSIYPYRLGKPEHHGDAMQSSPSLFCQDFRNFTPLLPSRKFLKYNPPKPMFLLRTIPLILKSDTDLDSLLKRICARQIRWGCGYYPLQLALVDRWHYCLFWSKTNRMTDGKAVAPSIRDGADVYCDMPKASATVIVRIETPSASSRTRRAIATHW